MTFPCTDDAQPTEPHWPRWTCRRLKTLTCGVFRSCDQIEMGIKASPRSAHSPPQPSALFGHHGVPLPNAPPMPCPLGHTGPKFYQVEQLVVVTLRGWLSIPSLSPGLSSQGPGPAPAAGHGPPGTPSGSSLPCGPVPAPGLGGGGAETTRGSFQGQVAQDLQLQGLAWRSASPTPTQQVRRAGRVQGRTQPGEQDLRCWLGSVGAASLEICQELPPSDRATQQLVNNWPLSPQAPGIFPADARTQAHPRGSGQGGSEVEGCPRPHSHPGVELHWHQPLCFPPTGLSGDH